MSFFFSLILATIWVVIGYFVLFSSTKSQGAMRMFGRVLAIWLFIIAASAVGGGAYMALSGSSPFQSMMQSMHQQK